MIFWWCFDRNLFLNYVPQVIQLKWNEVVNWCKEILWHVGWLRWNVCIWKDWLMLQCHSSCFLTRPCSTEIDEVSFLFTRVLNVFGFFIFSLSLPLSHSNEIKISQLMFVWSFVVETWKHWTDYFCNGKKVNIRWAKLHLLHNENEQK